MEEEILEPTEPVIEEPDKNLNISGIEITLCNELIQLVNETLNVTFTCKSGMDEIVAAFSENEVIEYDDQRYEKYQVVTGFSMNVDNMGVVIYKIELEKLSEPEPEPEITEDQEFAIAYAVAYMSDTDALDHRSLFGNYEDIEEGAEIVQGTRLNFNGGLWKCKKTHNKNSETWFPGNEPTLFEQLDKDGHAGTKEDPIPVPDSVTTSGFTYIVGKYYLDGEDLYLCKREGMEDGQECELFYRPSQVINQYFVKVEEE